MSANGEVAIDPAFVDAIPNQQKQGLMKTLLSTIGIKTQDTSMPTTAAPHQDFNSTSYTPPAPPSSYGPSSMGTASGIHYSPARDIQNRKAL